MGGRWSDRDIRPCTLAVMLLCLGLAAGRLSPDVSTAVFGGMKQHSLAPLAVLQTNHSGDDGTRPSLLKIFAEDPEWPSKVKHFMSRTGANVHGIDSALTQVRHVSWAAGRTLRGKAVVLLALAEWFVRKGTTTLLRFDIRRDNSILQFCRCAISFMDALSKGEGRVTSRVTRAVSAASRHTSDAHFILVANGFELEATKRRDMESALNGKGWRTFTTIEMPEFEGFSSAVNRAMKTVPDNSVVAVLSTSAILLPSEAAEATNGDADSTCRVCAESSDVFIAYERLKSKLSLAPTIAFEDEDSSWWSEVRATEKFCSQEHGDHASASSEGASHDECGNVSTHSSGLLVTAVPFDCDIDWQDDDGDCTSASSSERVGADDGASEKSRDNQIPYRSEDGGKHERARSTGSPLPPTVRPPPPSQKRPAMRLSQMASLPLLVFDVETYIALGDLDERFAFQGGIAEWMSRAKVSNSSEIISDKCARDDGCPCRACDRRRPGVGDAARRAIEGTRLSFSGSQARHVHEYGWGKRFVRSWSDTGGREGDDAQPRGSTSTVKDAGPHKYCPRVDRIRDDEQRSASQERLCQKEGIETGGSCQIEDDGNRNWDEEVVLDQTTRLSKEKVEALVQADADMFFLPLLLQQSAPDPASNDDRSLTAGYLAFSAEWMKRPPDELLARSALDRRKQFPVAVVVVLLDGTSLLCAALQEVAVVVEHILVVVSNMFPNGSAKDNSRLLHRLNLLLKDPDSPTHGKLRVEVGSWPTEIEQREHGNTIVREDSRNFSRVVVMDTGEFWHPVELATALAIAHQHPEATSLRAGVHTQWTRVRSVEFPPDIPHDVWLVDPRRCVWGDHRETVCGDEGSSDMSRTLLTLSTSIGVIHRLSHHEERRDSEELQLRPVSGTLAVVDVSERNGGAAPLWSTHATRQLPFGFDAFSAETSWARLSEATTLRHLCANPPCQEGKQIHAGWTDLGQEMSRVEGAVVVRRPDLASNIAPANSLDFVKTFQAYFSTFRSSLFPIRTMVEGHLLEEVEKIRRFVDAVAREDSEAARYLSTYYTDVEVPKWAIDGYENIPTLVGMAGVFVNELGYVWNKKNYIVPKSCWTHKFGPRASTSLPTGAKTYEKVFVMTQHWGFEYFHFMVEALPRITVALDFLRENLDIKVAVLGPPPDRTSRTQYVCELLELLGIAKDRVIFVQNEIHADLAILPSSVPCGKPDTQSVNVLRRNLLQAMYPSTGGVPPPVPRPVVVLIVRHSTRGMKNNDKVREAMEQNLPSYDIVEFLGTGPVLSQLQTFATASLVVAPHGAGLANMIVSSLHTPVLEIGPPDCSTCFLHLALKLQHIYGRHTGNGGWMTPCASWYEPDVDEIILLIRDLFEAKGYADAADPPNVVDVRL